MNLVRLIIFLSDNSGKGALNKLILIRNACSIDMCVNMNVSGSGKNKQHSVSFDYDEETVSPLISEYLPLLLTPHENIYFLIIACWYLVIKVH